MINNFTTICQLQVFHTYYENNICNGLLYQATPNTQDIFKRYGFTMIPEINGFRLLSSQNQPISQLLNYISSIASIHSFEFEVQPTDQNFFLFTQNIPVTELGTLSFNSNNTNTTENTLSLTPQFIPKTESNSAINISIQFQDLIKLNNQDQNVNYTIHLKARNTQWSYYIINQNKHYFSNLSIQSNSDIQFDKKTNVKLPNGQKAILFSSKSYSIPLSKIPKHQFDLVDKQSTKLKKTITVFKGLPTPTPDNIKLDQSKETTLVSSLMYVYV